MAGPFPDGFHVMALDDGNIEFGFVVGGEVKVHGRMTPEQVGTVAANLLNASHGAFHNADLILPASMNYRCPSVAVSRWSVVKPQGKDQFAMAIEAGQTVIAFTIPTPHIRPVARSLIDASYEARSLSSWGFVSEGLLDCAAIVRGTGTVIGQRVVAAMRRNWSELRAILAGRSLRIFSRIAIGADTSVPEYLPFQECIYCGSQVYSTKPGIRTTPLGAEHIVPGGLGGTLELPEASCQKCEDTTGRLVEGDVLGRTLKALRVHLRLKKKGSGPHPKSLPIDAMIDGKNQKMELPIEDYPIVFGMLHFEPPSFVPSHVDLGRVVIGYTMAVLKHDQKALYKKYKITGFSTASWDSQMFTRMLAKIGHSLAVANLGKGAFKPLLLDLICEGQVRAMNLVGGSPIDTPLRDSKALHELDLGYQRMNGVTYVVARIRLFASHGGPRYHVVVGEALESRIAIVRRVLSSRISRIPAR